MNGIHGMLIAVALMMVSSKEHMAPSAKALERTLQSASSEVITRYVTSADGARIGNFGRSVRALAW